MEELDLLCINRYGFTWDFFNEVPFDLTSCRMDEFIERCINGKVRTYSQRYCKEPKILSASSKHIINQLDGLVESMIDAAQKKDFLLVEQSLKKIYSYRK